MAAAKVHVDYDALKVVASTFERNAEQSRRTLHSLKSSLDLLH